MPKIVERLELDNGIEVSDDIKEQWDYFAPPEDSEESSSTEVQLTQVGPLLETRWGQGRG